MCVLWKVGKSPEKFGGKKVKCKCGTVGLVPQPVSADYDLLNMDLGEIQYQAVAPAKPKSQAVAGKNKPDSSLMMLNKTRNGPLFF